MRKLLLGSLIAVLTVVVVTAHPVMAEQFLLGGNPLNIMGYITQGGAVSLTDPAGLHDAERDFQSVLTNVFLEADYKPRPDLKFYLSGMFTADWIYDLKSDSKGWNDKLFSKSRKQGLYMDNEYWQLLKEAHVTWTPSNSLLRIGKQIVSWGETDGFRLMDQINPQDMRRGFADVEFETSIIPIWLVRAEYYVSRKPSWLQDLGFEFVFNPNITFIPNQGVTGWGNDVGGIWTPRLWGPIPGSQMGSADFNIDKPKAFNSNGFAYAFRTRAVVADSTITLNYYYGLDKDPVLKMGAGWPWVDMAPDGQLLVHMHLDGRYPLFRFAGATFSRDITPLKSGALGGVSPVLRLEGIYGFSNTFTSANTMGYEHHDEMRWAAGVDWKVKIGFLNPRAYFMISPQFYHRKIMDFPSNTKEIWGGGLAPLRENSYTTTLLVTTSYLHNKLSPSVFWMNDRTNHANFFRYQLVYDYTDAWHFTAGAMKFNGDKKNRGFELFRDKDQLYFKLGYKWS
jgi:hypothetical protein